MWWVVNATSRPLYPPGERAGAHCIEGWVGPSAGLDRCGISRPTGIRSPDRPARSESQYRLSYPGPFYIIIIYISIMGARGGVVAKALRYKPAGRGFDSRWCHWNFSGT